MLLARATPAAALRVMTVATVGLVAAACFPLSMMVPHPGARLPTIEGTGPTAKYPIKLCDLVTGRFVTLVASTWDGDTSWVAWISAEPSSSPPGAGSGSPQ